MLSFVFTFSMCWEAVSVNVSITDMLPPFLLIEKFEKPVDNYAHVRVILVQQQEEQQN